jgi:hypothetical protein
VSQVRICAVCRGQIPPTRCSRAPAKYCSARCKRRRKTETSGPKTRSAKKPRDRKVTPVCGTSRNDAAHDPIAKVRYTPTTPIKVAEELRAMTLAELDACWVGVLAEAHLDGVRELAAAMTVVRDKYRAEGQWTRAAG